MASLDSGDEGGNLLNDNINDNLPSDDDSKENNANNENLFDEANNGDGAGDGEQDAVKVEPKKRLVRNPRPKLTVETLRGPRGIHTIEDYCKDIKFKGKGHEKHDLDEVMRRLQHWGHRMYPTYKFDDILANIERLGKKKPLQVHMSRYRLGMLDNLKFGEEHGLEDDEEVAEAPADEPFDEFDALLGEQIAISKLVPRTPASSNASRYAADNMSVASSSSTFTTPSLERANAVMSTPFSRVNNFDTSDLATPLPPSQPSAEELQPPSQPSGEGPAPKKLTADQMAKIAENRRLAQERLRARQRQQQEHL